MSLFVATSRRLDGWTGPSADPDAESCASSPASASPLRTTPRQYLWSPRGVTRTPERDPTATTESGHKDATVHDDVERRWTPIQSTTARTLFPPTHCDVGTVWDTRAVETHAPVVPDTVCRTKTSRFAVWHDTSEPVVPLAVRSTTSTLVVVQPSVSFAIETCRNHSDTVVARERCDPEWLRIDHYRRANDTTAAPKRTTTATSTTSTTSTIRTTPKTAATNTTTMSPTVPSVSATSRHTTLGRALVGPRGVDPVTAPTPTRTTLPSLTHTKPLTPTPSNARILRDASGNQPGRPAVAPSEEPTHDFPTKMPSPPVASSIAKENAPTVSPSVRSDSHDVVTITYTTTTESVPETLWSRVVESDVSFLGDITDTPDRDTSHVHANPCDPMDHAIVTDDEDSVTSTSVHAVGNTSTRMLDVSTTEESHMLDLSIETGPQCAPSAEHDGHGLFGADRTGDTDNDSGKEEETIETILDDSVDTGSVLPLPDANGMDESSTAGEDDPRPAPQKNAPLLETATVQTEQSNEYMSDRKSSTVVPPETEHPESAPVLSWAAVAKTTPSKPKTLNNRATSPSTIPVFPAPTHNKVTTAPLDTSSSTWEHDGLLVLCSHQSLDRSVTVNQIKVFTILGGHNISYETIDGADPVHKQTRNHLFEVSGLKAQYPQFFLVRNGELTFWGDFHQFVQADQNGELQVALAAGVELAPVIRPIETAMVDTEDTYSIEAGNVPKLLVLCSNQTMSRRVTSHQEKAYTILKAHRIPFETLDGADAWNKSRREELFQISGLRAQYPQFFLIDETSGTTTFWGDWERFMYANEDDVLVNELGLTPSYAPEQLQNHVNTANDTHASKTERMESFDSNAGNSEGTDANEKRFLVLYSSQSLDRQVTVNQEKAYSVLTNKGIPFETLDGIDPDNVQRRNTLFRISGLRGTYPQFFIVDGHTTEFWGDWNRFNKARKAGKLSILSTPIEKEKIAKGIAQASTGQSAAGTGKAHTENQNTSASSSAATSSGTGGPSSHSESNSNTRSSQAVATVQTTDRISTKTDITIYGATSFVAKHVITYIMQTSIHGANTLKVTLAGRSSSKVQALTDEFSQKMKNLFIVSEKPQGKCVFDFFIAESSNPSALGKMASRTKVVLNCAGPFTRLGSNVVAACAKTGADYVDITGEIEWASEMRQLYSADAAKSGSRIISFCGFDSIPSDLAVYTAIKVMKEKLKQNAKPIETASTYHSNFGLANGGTLQTVSEMSLNLRHCLFRWVPYLLNDPLALTHPSDRSAQSPQETRNRMAKAEWINQLPFFHSIFRMGVSSPFFMAPVNTKVVNASAVANNYGPSFTYYERYVPTGFRFTVQLGTLSLLPAVVTQFLIYLAAFLIKFPILGPLLIQWFMPPGSGASDLFCKTGYAEVYADVVTSPNAAGKVDKANCFLAFEGDPGNWVTAQTVAESALALALNKKDLPPRSQDGFGTPTEILGGVLLKRLTETKIRPVVVVTDVRAATSKIEWSMFPLHVTMSAH
ncbi:predicted protein [Phaeodactylum tricornutum CCAP 1055/1]|uniref:Saccharopine dehydrogenase NADP binding domain-containing protein n=1 Tax=Phaeodactylum tricornutum (strain CCAP 1055/1) TaxID=556484 RepID=B7GE54_PHATC|nr:predicted protein [Phaeodactylum tricornutum CCAP 1055/1]EEC43046.1 predicted protein [Phaeodactylum tricornutum CCAP 1055/1]|eukprot:XP_002185377.1 predicted protein [Phaeodactylum tricornutum CCAP 1055/1]